MTSVIIAKKYGQLGNRLFLSANLIANAIENGYRVVDMAFEDYAEYFNGTARNYFCTFSREHNYNSCYGSYNKYQLRLRKIIYNCVNYSSRLFSYIHFNKNQYLRIISLKDKHLEYYDLNDIEFQEAVKQVRVIVLRGWKFRDCINFNKYADDIRYYFKPKPIHENNVRALISNVRGKCDVLIGMHIRWGDYKLWENGKYYYDINQYLKLMHTVKDMFMTQRVHFLICSNEIIDQKQLQGINCDMGNHHLIEDMYAFAKCDYIMGPPSTFTMWASFYGNVPLYKVRNPETTFTLNDFKVEKNDY